METCSAHDLMVDNFKRIEDKLDKMDEKVDILMDEKVAHDREDIVLQRLGKKYETNRTFFLGLIGALVGVFSAIALLYNIVR